MSVGILDGGMRVGNVEDEETWDKMGLTGGVGTAVNNENAESGCDEPCAVSPSVSKKDIKSSFCVERLVGGGICGGLGGAFGGGASGGGNAVGTGGDFSITLNASNDAVWSVSGLLKEGTSERNSISSEERARESFDDAFVRDEKRPRKRVTADGGGGVGSRIIASIGSLLGFP